MAKGKRMADNSSHKSVNKRFKEESKFNFKKFFIIFLIILILAVLIFLAYKFAYFWTLYRMYTSHSRRMPVILMPPSQIALEIFSHKPHTEVFSLLHHHTKFPVHTESLLRYLAKPVLCTSPSSRQEMCNSVQIPYSKLPSFHNHFCIFSSDKSSMTSCLNDTTMNWKKQWFRREKIS